MKLLAFNLFAMTVMFFAYLIDGPGRNPLWPRWVDLCLFVFCACCVLMQAYDIKQNPD